ncbi:MAG TPA: Holliday junction branch migration protein RuvA [Thermotogae bacterium]|nr:holliday junction helicase RuvA [Thermotogota bacterium]HCZ05852.1 Holliday junction branch migration protein RuvA [Thermotogota bacterium]
MIVSLEGAVESVNGGIVVINVSGIGFGVFVDSQTEAKIQPGEKVKLHISTVFTEKGMELYGFLDPQKQELFNTLLKISKIGPKMALRLLSHLKEEDLKIAMIHDDPSILQQVPGIGKKTAERLLFELKRLEEDLTPVVKSVPDISASNSTSQAIEALLSLGYDRSEAVSAVKKALQKMGDRATTEDIVKEALKGILSE